MAHPAEETEILPARARRDVGGDHRRFDDQRARAAHGIEKLRRRLAFLRPAGAQQDARGKILAQRRLAGLRAISAAMQALARQVDGHRDVGTVGVRVHAHAGRSVAMSGRLPVVSRS